MAGWFHHNQKGQGLIKMQPPIITTLRNIKHILLKLRPRHKLLLLSETRTLLPRIRNHHHHQYRQHLILVRQIVQIQPIHSTTASTLPISQAIGSHIKHRPGNWKVWVMPQFNTRATPRVHHRVPT
jgi:hypothetical protein